MYAVSGCQVSANAAAQVAAAKQATAEARAVAAADAERRVDESKAELASVKEQLAAVLEYKQRKEVLEEEVVKLNNEIAKLRADTTEQVWQIVVVLQWSYISLVSSQQYMLEYKQRKEVLQEEQNARISMLRADIT